jgi:hypothetical protein
MSRELRGPVTLLAAALAVALLSFPATARAQTPVAVALRGSWGALVEGEVAISSASGESMASGAVAREIVVRSSGPVDVAVTATSLVDRPTVVIRGVALPSGGAVNVPVAIQTGLIRARASINGRTVAGVVRLYRVDAATGATAAEACGSFGANTSSREISAGRYLAVLQSGGVTLSRVVEVAAGASRQVRLEG